jgi:hypothetical protein
MRSLILWGWLMLVLLPLTGEGEIVLISESTYPIYSQDRYEISFDSQGRLQSIVQTMRSGSSREFILWSEIRISKTEEGYNLVQWDRREGTMQISRDITIQEEGDRFVYHFDQSGFSGIVEWAPVDGLIYGHYYENQLISSVNLDPENLTKISNRDGHPDEFYRYDDSGYMVEIYNAEGTIAWAKWNGECYEIETVPFEGLSSSDYIYISEDYIPPENMMVRVFNVFSTWLGGNRILMPFFAGYF